MVRGQDGSLLLSCMTLSFTTSRRFIPTLTSLVGCSPHRLLDPATLRRWAWRRLLTLFGSLKTLGFCSPRWPSFLSAPSILAWDWSAVGRTLHLEANSP